MNEEKRKGLMELNSGDLVLVAIEKSGIMRSPPLRENPYIKTGPTPKSHRLELNLGVLNDAPEKDERGYLVLPMNKTLINETSSIALRGFDSLGISIGGFLLNSAGFYSNNINELHKRLDNIWAERKFPLQIGPFDWTFNFYKGNEIHKRFWNPNLFQNESGLDLSYVFALNKLGVEIPEDMKKQYQEDIQKLKVYTETLAKHKRSEGEIESEKSLFSKILFA